MCGIIGYIGNKKASNVLLSGLKRLEYRGYDSAGICTIEESDLITTKCIGKVSDLENNINEGTHDGFIGIGHTRWATHGGVTQANAHPHLSYKREFVIVHNGIFSNYQELREQLMDQDVVFESLTDTEVFVNLLEASYSESNDLEKAFKWLDKADKCTRKLIDITFEWIQKRNLEIISSIILLIIFGILAQLGIIPKLIN